MTSTLVVWVGLGLLVTCFVVGHDLATTSDAMEKEVKRTDTLILSNVRTLSETQRELLRLQHALDIDEPASQVRLLAGFVSQRTHESALSYQSTTLGTADLLAIARENETTWKESVLPAVRTALRPGRDAATAERKARAGIADLELSYNYLASQGEINRRAQVSSTNETSTDLAHKLQRMLVMFTVLFSAGLMAGFAGFVSFIRVNRRRARAVHELRVVNDDLAFYSRIVHASDSALVATDRDGNITWVNDAFEQASGWTLDQVRGRRPGDFLTGPSTEPDVIAEVNAAVAAGRHVRAELAQYTAEGREYWVATDISPLTNDAGEVDGFFAVQTDITERHAAERLLNDARDAAELAVQQKSAFLATMSHEIRTPLNAVLGLTDLLLLTGLDEEQRDYVETAHRSGNHLLELINDVLDYSALEAGRLDWAAEPLSMPQLLHDTVAMLNGPAATKGTRLELDCATDVPSLVLGDPTRLRQVLVNVIGNAVKFTDHGIVTVTCRITEYDLDHGTCHIVTTVRDTGIGIPEWRIPELFESFARGDISTTREYGGTGLGLAISRGLLTIMGGNIELQSTLGEGTTVTITTVHELPLEEFIGNAASPPRQTTSSDVGVTPQQEARGGAEGRSLGRLRVLVAEDDPVNRKVVTGMLTKLGLTPTVVNNGHDAVAAVTAGPTDGHDGRRGYDVVLMDVEMPVMDGLCAVGRIRQALAEPSPGTGQHGAQRAALPDAARPGARPWFIALTANALTGDRERFLDAGMDDYLAKPFTLHALKAALERSQSVPA